MKSYPIDQMKLFLAINSELTRQHPDIPSDHRANVIIKAANMICDEYAREMILATEGMGLPAWLDSDDTGASSLYMAWILSAGQFGYWQGRPQPTINYPHDPDDLGRCIRLIKAVPEFADQLHLMAHVGDKWQMVINRWERWCDLYRKEDWELLYAEMKLAYEGGIK